MVAAAPSLEAAALDEAVEIEGVEATFQPTLANDLPAPRLEAAALDEAVGLDGMEAEVEPAARVDSIYWMGWKSQVMIVLRCPSVLNLMRLTTLGASCCSAC